MRPKWILNRVGFILCTRCRGVRKNGAKISIPEFWELHASCPKPEPTLGKVPPGPTPDRAIDHGRTVQRTVGVNHAGNVGKLPAGHGEHNR